jgi:hypothetical protein
MRPEAITAAGWTRFSLIRGDVQIASGTVCDLHGISQDTILAACGGKPPTTPPDTTPRAARPRSK